MPDSHTRAALQMATIHILVLAIMTATDPDLYRFAAPLSAVIGLVKFRHSGEKGLTRLELHTAIIYGFLSFLTMIIGFMLDARSNPHS